MRKNQVMLSLPYMRSSYIKHNRPIASYLGRGGGGISEGVMCCVVYPQSMTACWFQRGLGGGGGGGGIRG